MSFQFCNHLDGEERAGCLISLIILLFPVVLLHIAVGWYAVCDCGIFRSYSFAFCLTLFIFTLYLMPKSFNLTMHSTYLHYIMAV